MGGFGIGKCDPCGILYRQESVLSCRYLHASGTRTDGAAPEFRPTQLTLVMVQPQRGHSEPCPERQVVPQWEQVEAVAALPPLAQVPQA